MVDFNGDLSIVDGMPLVWMARLHGISIREKVTGSGMFEGLRGGPTHRLSIYFFGGPAGWPRGRVKSSMPTEAILAFYEKPR